MVGEVPPGLGRVVGRVGLASYVFGVDEIAKIFDVSVERRCF